MASHAEAPVDMLRALELSLSLGVSAYEAQYLSLAEHANAILVTEDKRLRAAAGTRTRTRTRSMAEQLAA